MNSLSTTPRLPAQMPAPARHDVTPRRAALVAGLGYVALFGLAIFANFVVLDSIVVDGDPAATLANITSSPGPFRLAIVAFLVITVVDVVVAWSLHVLLRDAAPERSLLAAWLRILHSVFLGVGLAFLSQVDHLAATASTHPSAATETAAAQLALALDTFDAMWMIGLAFFGLHLIVVATLLTGPRTAPRPLRIILAVAGAAYIIDTVAHIALADYQAIAGVMLAIVALPSVLGEGWFGLWLLTRAGGPEDIASAPAIRRQETGS